MTDMSTFAVTSLDAIKSPIISTFEGLSKHLSRNSSSFPVLVSTRVNTDMALPIAVLSVKTFFAKV